MRGNPKSKYGNCCTALDFSPSFERFVFSVFSDFDPSLDEVNASPTKVSITPKNERPQEVPGIRETYSLVGREKRGFSEKVKHL